MLAKEFHVEFVIPLKDPQGMAFSENTNIGELLVIGRRWGEGEDQTGATTTFVKVMRKPMTPALAKFMGEAILRGDDSSDYALTQWTQDRMLAGDWFPTQFIRDEVVQTFVSISESEWFPSATGKAAGEQISRPGRGIRDTYRRSTNSTVRQALWEHKTDVQRTMASKPDHYITSKPGKERLADAYWQQRGRVLIPTRLSISNTRITTVLSEPATVGNAFAPYHPSPGPHDLSDVEKATVAYLNSTAGIIAMLGVTTNRKIVYPNWSVDDWYQVPFPDWGKLTSEQVEALAAAYDELCHSELQELRAMLKCDTRRQLDDAVAAALGIPSNMMEAARIALASEPAVTGKTFTGDALVGGLL